MDLLVVAAVCYFISLVAFEFNQKFISGALFATSMEFILLSLILL